jgi:16S rRNA (adenine(1408)-N(1))-methyltransferase
LKRAANKKLHLSILAPNTQQKRLALAAHAKLMRLSFIVYNTLRKGTRNLCSNRFVAAPSNISTNKPSENLSSHTAGGVVVDIGTGDGRFVYQCARLNPEKFFIGVDANAKALEKISEKIYRKPAKGGLPNVLFVQAAVENLPAEFNSVADEIHVHFPWGSLLRAVATGDACVLGNLRRIAAPDCLLEIVIGLDPERDRTEIERLGLPVLSNEYLETVLTGRYSAAGFDVLEKGAMSQADWSRLETSWARKLFGNADREVVYLIARARS